MHVADLWRYPVKSLAGQRLDVATVEADGLVGDRLVHVRDGRGLVVTSRRKPALLGLHGALDAGGEPTIDHHPWDSTEAAAAVRAAAGDDARATRFAGPDEGQRYDVLPLTVLSDGMIEHLGYDVRRFRPNLVVGGAPGLIETEWPGRALRIEGVLLGVKKRRQRCVMTTFDPDTQEQDPQVLRRIARELRGLLALDCWVIEAGPIHVGALVEVVDLPDGTEIPADNGSRRAGPQ